jgi:molybdopterin converting factor small subunit
MASLRIPTPLRPFTAGQQEVIVAGVTVGEALNHLITQYPDLEKHLFNENEVLRPFVNLFLGEEEVRHLQGLDTPLTERDRLVIVPSIAGG